MNSISNQPQADPPVELDPVQHDAADMKRLVAGQDAALNELMDRYGPPLFHYLIRLLQNEDDAADAAQGAFVRVYQNRAAFNPKGKFSSWLYTIATNLARDQLRYRARHPAISLEAENESTGGDFHEDLSDYKPTPSDNLEAEERAASVRTAVGLLPEELRTPLLLAEYESLAQSEIGTILGCSPKAVETRIYRARQQLRPLLTKLLG